jgi:hypothetical protein
MIQQVLGSDTFRAFTVIDNLRFRIRTSSARKIV